MAENPKIYVKETLSSNFLKIAGIIVTILVGAPTLYKFLKDRGYINF